MFSVRECQSMHPSEHMLNKYHQYHMIIIRMQPQMCWKITKQKI